jgi:hypothetical protein
MFSANGLPDRVQVFPQLYLNSVAEVISIRNVVVGVNIVHILSGKIFPTYRTRRFLLTLIVFHQTPFVKRMHFPTVVFVSIIRSGNRVHANRTFGFNIIGIIYDYVCVLYIVMFFIIFIDLGPVC